MITLLDAIALLLLFLLMLALGSSIDTVAFKSHFTAPKPLLLGLFLQFIVQPPLAITTATLYNLPPLQATALLIVCSCPGGSMSNIICVIFQADLTLSIAMTAASSLIAIFMLPANIYLYGGLIESTSTQSSPTHVKIDFQSILLSTLVVVAATGLGYKIKTLAHHPTLLYLAKIGVVSGILVVGNAFRLNLGSDMPVYKAEPRFIMACASQILLSLTSGLVCSRLLANLPGPSCMSIATETSTQNTIIALSILGLSLPASDAAAASVIPLIYGTCNTTTNVLFGLFSWKVMGWSNMSKDATVRQMWMSYRDLLKVKPEDFQELDDNGRRKGDSDADSTPLTALTLRPVMVSPDIIDI